MRSLGAVADVLEAGRREEVAPALAAVVLRDGATVHATVHGEVPAPGPRALREDDLFDVASLTKVMATTTLAAQLVAEGLLSLDGRVAERLPAFAEGGKEGITLRHLLAHASGLPRWRPYFEQAAADGEAAAIFLPPAARPPAAALARPFARSRAIVAAAVLGERPERPPGTRALYCDPGFISLGLVVEVVLGRPLAVAAEERVFGPLGLSSTFFLDLVEPERARARAAGRAFVPTGRSAPRREDVQGAVNDDNAWALGGVAGHAGLFSTAAEVAALGQAWLEATRGQAGVVAPDVAREFARRDGTPGSERALGWDRPSAEGSSIGARLGRGPRGAIGHLGFTGTSLWIDLDAGVVCALLTNHVHPSGSSDRERIKGFRRRFHDAVAEGLGIG